MKIYNDSAVGYGEIAGDDDMSKSDMSRFKIALTELFYPLYQRFYGGREQQVETIDRRLDAANINTTVEGYLARTLAYGTLIGIALGIVFGVLAYVLLGDYLSVLSIPYSFIPFQETELVQYALENDLLIKLALATVLAGLVGGGLGIAGAFLLASWIPSMLASKREREIDILMPSLIAFMYSLSSEGIQRLSIFESVAESEDTLGEAAVEFQRIVRRMDYFHEDYMTAVTEVAARTPSDDMAKFLNDLVNVIETGGDMQRFLEDEKENYIDRLRRKQETQLETLETFGQMYLTLSIMPILLIVILAVQAITSGGAIGPMYGIVYGLIPLLNILFLVSISIFKTDEVGTGEIELQGKEDIAGRSDSILDLPVADKHERSGDDTFIGRVKRGEIRHRISKTLSNPISYMTSYPKYSLWLSVPLAAIVTVILALQGFVPTSIDAMVANAYTGTLAAFYVPATIILAPLALFTYLNHRAVYGVTDTLTDTLRELANNNQDAGPIGEAIRITGENNNDTLANEMEIVAAKADFGQPLKTGLAETGNTYKVPRLSRALKLIIKAIEVSTNIRPVLETAAETSRVQDKIEKDRKSQTLQTVVVQEVSLLVFIALMVVMDVMFVSTLESAIGSSESFASNFGGGTDTDAMGMIFFHAATIQAVLGGLVSGYLRSGEISSSWKYILLNLGLVAIIWGGAQLIF